MPRTNQQRHKLPSPSSASLKDQNALLRQHRKACSSTIHPRLLFENFALSWSISLALFVYVHIHVYIASTCWANIPPNAPKYISVWMSTDSANKEFVDIDTQQYYPAEIFQQGLYFQCTNNSRETNLKHNDATTSPESFQLGLHFGCCSCSYEDMPMQRCQQFGGSTAITTVWAQFLQLPKRTAVACPKMQVSTGWCWTSSKYASTMYFDCF